MVEDCFSPIERAIREVCHTRKIPQPDIWENGEVHTSELYKDPETVAEYSKRVEDKICDPEFLTIGRVVETRKGDRMRCVQVTLTYEGREPVIIASVNDQAIEATFKGMKQDAQVQLFIRAAQELVGVHNGKRGKFEVDRQFLVELVGDFYDLIEVAQIYFKPVEDNGHLPVSDN